jgi:hypothetical protein
MIPSPMVTKVAATPYDNLMAEFWPTNAHRGASSRSQTLSDAYGELLQVYRVRCAEVFNVGLLAIIAVQPVLAAVAYRATAGMPRRLAWIWY